jgi:hypothetical protein
MAIYQISETEGLSPVIAILTMDSKRRMFRGNEENFLDIARAGQDAGIMVYVTTTNHLKLSERRILGYIYDFEQNKWEPQMLPLPDVIYNRIPTRKDEMTPEVQQVLQTCLKRRRIHIFNPSFFNKWTLFEWLSKAKKTKRFIPITKQLTSSRQLAQLLRMHSTLYLKPDHGKAGKGIMKVQRVPVRIPKGSLYRLTIQEQKRSQTMQFADLASIWNEIKQYIDDEEYIVQQGIPLSSYKNRPFDLRVLLQKNGKGIWTITGVGARVAGKQAITTHVPKGGSIDDPAKLLDATFGQSIAKNLMQRVKKATLMIAKQIEKKSGHSLGEMSLDLGIDTSGNIWFFEANSKPMKFDEPDIRKKSLERTIEYCIYLSKKRSSTAS